MNASVSAGKLTVAADSAAVELSFSQDSSGVLASLGVNNFFTGKPAAIQRRAAGGELGPAPSLGEDVEEHDVRSAGHLHDAHLNTVDVADGAHQSLGSLGLSSGVDQLTRPGVLAEHSRPGCLVA